MFQREVCETKSDTIASVMWPFYKMIIHRAIIETPAVVSSNWIAVAVAAIIFVATLILRSRRQQGYKQAATFRGKVSAVFGQWMQLLRDGVALSLIGWLFVFAISLASTVYAEHQQISTLASVFEQQRDAASRDRDSLRVDNERLKRAVQTKNEAPEPKDSLRRRTFSIAKEVSEFIANRIANRPPDAFPNSNDPNPTEDRKRAIKVSQDYARETETIYEDRYRDRLVGIVKEYESKGVTVRWLANDFQQHAPYLVFVGSAAEGSPNDEIYQLKELAYHVDAHDHLITIY